MQVGQARRLSGRLFLVSMCPKGIKEESLAKKKYQTIIITTLIFLTSVSYIIL